MSNKHISLTIPVLLVFFLNGCLKEEIIPLNVATENILLVTGERLVITGRVLATSEVEIFNHGFEVATDETFSGAQSVDLGERTLPGRFVASFDALDVNRQYVVRAFVEDASGKIYGNALTFSTLEPIIDDFSPKVGISGRFLTIQGRNFTNDARVFINGEEMPVESIENESFIHTRIPDFQGEIFVPVVVTMKDKEYVAPQLFEFVRGTWEDIDRFNLPNHNLFANISFRTEDEIVVGLGSINGFGPYINKVFKYDIQSGEWSDVFYPGPIAGFSFSCDGLMGSGSSDFVRAQDARYNLLDDYYLYEEGSFQYGGKLPFTLLKGRALRIGRFAYVIGGLKSNTRFSEFIYRYDFESDTWEEWGTIPFGLETTSDYPATVHQGYIYYISASGKLIKMNPETGVTQILSTYPGSVASGGFAEGVGEKLQIGTFLGSREVYEYDLNSDAWKQKVSYPGNSRDRVVASWTDSEAVYLLKNSNRPDIPMTIWKFSPENI